jgi:hypothetical protein
MGERNGKRKTGTGDVPIAIVPRALSTAQAPTGAAEQQRSQKTPGKSGPSVKPFNFRDYRGLGTPTVIMGVALRALSDAARDDDAAVPGLA